MIFFAVGGSCDALTMMQPPAVKITDIYVFDHDAKYSTTGDVLG